MGNRLEKVKVSKSGNYIKLNEQQLADLKNMIKADIIKSLFVVCGGKKRYSGNFIAMLRAELEIAQKHFAKYYIYNEFADDAERKVNELVSQFKEIIRSHTVILNKSMSLLEKSLDNVKVGRDKDSNKKVNTYLGGEWG